MVLRDFPLTKEELQQRRATREPVETRFRTNQLRGEPSKFWSTARGLTSQQMAHLGEAAIQFRLTLHGFRSFRSGFDGDRVDFVVLDGPRTLRLQVKCVKQTSSGKGLPGIVLLRTVGHTGSTRYTAEEVDFIVGYWAYNETVTDQEYHS